MCVYVDLCFTAFFVLMKDLLSYWQWNYSSLAGLMLLFIIYLLLWRRFVAAKLLAFLSAVGLLSLCLFSSLALLSSEYLFSIHMVVHVVILLIVAPLLVLALPEELPRRLHRFFTSLRFHPWLSWVCGVGVMWFWHVPAVFNRMMDHSGSFHEVLHLCETISLIIAGMIFSFPVLRERDKMHPLASVIYLSSACVFCSLLGLMITFAPPGLYYHFLSSQDPLQINEVIQHQWHISQEDDQQAAGLIMWVPCCMIYVGASLYLVLNWFSKKQEDADPSTPVSKIS